MVKYYITEREIKFIMLLNEPMTTRGLARTYGKGYGSFYSALKKLQERGFVEMFIKEDLNYGKVQFYKRTIKGQKIIEIIQEK